MTAEMSAALAELVTAGTVAIAADGQTLLPSSREALVAVLARLHELGEAVVPCGAGTKLSWGGGAIAGVPVSTRKLDRLVEHAVGDLTVTAEAGVTLAHLQAMLAARGQFVPLDPAYGDRATLGGIVATADAGSWRQRYGGVRDLLIGIEFVRADGRVARAGGRVVKNVAGYDLMKLLTGSYGTLGAIAQVTLRTYPLPEASGTCALSGSASQIAAVFAALRRSTLTPTAADALSGQALVALGLGAASDLGGLVRFQSVNASVRVQQEQLAAIARAAGARCTAIADEAGCWQQVASLVHPPPVGGATCKVGMATGAVELLAELADSEVGIVHTGSGLGRLQLAGSDLVRRVGELRARCQTRKGFLTVLEAPEELARQLDMWGYAGNALPVMHRLKQAFDPEQRLSPGRFVDGI